MSARGWLPWKAKGSVQVVLRRIQEAVVFPGETLILSVEGGNAVISALEAGEIDANYQSFGETVTLLDGMGLVKEEVITAATIVMRTNLNNKPYDDKRVHNALQLAP